MRQAIITNVGLIVETGPSVTTQLYAETFWSISLMMYMEHR